MNKHWRKTKLTELLGITYPIVQGPFGGGLSSVALTSTVSELGGLGSFGGQPYTADELIAFVVAIRKQTSKPFNINLWVSDHDARAATYSEADYQKLAALFKPYFDELGLPLPAKPELKGPFFNEQLEAIYETKPAVFSFVYGIPDATVLEKCRSLGIKTVGAATTIDEAVALEQAGVDALVATGFEAGGHRVSFLRSAEESLTGTFALIPQVADNVKIPVIAAGGIADARGIRAAFALGADAVQMGTVFLATNESNAAPDHKEKLFLPEARYTTLTRVFTGRLARGIVNKLTYDFRDKESMLAPYPLQGKLMHALKAYPANAEGTGAYKSNWAGQSAGLLKYRDAAALFKALTEAMEKV